MQKTDFMNAVSRFEYPNFPHYMLRSWSRGKVYNKFDIERLEKKQNIWSRTCFKVVCENLKPKLPPLFDQVDVVSVFFFFFLVGW